MSAKTTSEANKPAKKTKTVYLERRKKGENSVEVMVGGLEYTVPRGKPVEVPVAVAEVLNRREQYAMQAMDYEESNQDHDA